MDLSLNLASPRFVGDPNRIVSQFQQELFQKMENAAK